MLSLEVFHKIHECRDFGLSKRKTGIKLGIAPITVKKWWNATESDFLDVINTRFRYLDNYKEFMLEQLRICPQIKVTNLFYKVIENFPDFNCPRSAFYRYNKKLRADYGFAKFSGRQTFPRAPLPPGYESQVDFGQSKVLDMYGRIVRVYFFCMVLSYSRMHFVYFNSEPFTTETAIQAHEYAFRYFGGRTQTIMYDQDRVFVVNENLGNIIFVPEFEEYVNTVGYSVVLCRPRDPQTKGKVETFVKYVKDNFLEGRIFTGIDSLNSAALSWLDVEANGTPNCDTKRIPRDAFADEAQELKKVAYRGEYATNIRNVSMKYNVTYKGVQYQIPKELVKVKETLRIEEENEMLVFHRASTGDVIYTTPKAEQPGKQIIVKPQTKDEAVSVSTLKRLFDGNEVATEFLKRMGEQVNRYRNTHYRWVIKLSHGYTGEQMEEAMGYCNSKNKCDVNELAAYLIYRYGGTYARKAMKQYMFYQCRQRAEQIQEEQNEQHI